MFGLKQPIIIGSPFVDSPSAFWDISKLKIEITRLIDKLDVKHVRHTSTQKTLSSLQVITFDNGGVSKHLNHVQTYDAVRQVSPKKNVQKWTLHTVPWIIKYNHIGCLIYTLFLMLVTDSRVVLRPRLWKQLRALSYHRSQFVWFRILFAIFSW